jgi:hypothetical protein
MFDKLVGGILAKYLGKFCTNFDEKSVNMCEFF